MTDSIGASAGVGEPGRAVNPVPSAEQVRFLPRPSLGGGTVIPRPSPDKATEIRWLRDALERTDQALRAVLAGRSVRDADEVLSANAWLLFADPTGATAE